MISTKTKKHRKAHHLRRHLVKISLTLALVLAALAAGQVGNWASTQVGGSIVLAQVK